MQRTLVSLLLIVLTGCAATPPLRSAPAPPSAAPPEDTLYVIRRSWHIDIGLASSALPPALASLRSNFPGARYLLFGFGDRRYLLSKTKSLNTIRALWHGPGLLLITALRTSPQDAFGDDNVMTFSITSSQAFNLQTHIWRSFRAVDQPLGEGPYAGSLYYEAVQQYSAFYTCNTWAAQASQAAGLPVRRFGVIFAGQLWAQLRRLAHANSVPRLLTDQGVP